MLKHLYKPYSENYLYQNASDMKMALLGCFFSAMLVLTVTISLENGL